MSPLDAIVGAVRLRFSNSLGRESLPKMRDLRKVQVRIKFVKYTKSTPSGHPDLIYFSIAPGTMPPNRLYNSCTALTHLWGYHFRTLSLAINLISLLFFFFFPYARDPWPFRLFAAT